MFQQLFNTYTKVGQSFVPLAKAVAACFVLALIGQLIAGVRDMNTQAMQFNLRSTLGAAIHVLALLMAWYSAHKYLITGKGITAWPSKDELRFVLIGLLNVAILTVLAIIVLLPIVLVVQSYVGDATDEEIVLYINRLSMLAPFIMFYVYSRLLLSAPMLARRQPHPNAESWRLTKGHMTRLFVLQMGCVAPIILAAVLSYIAQDLNPFSMVISLSGSFLSIMLFAQLAEDEYARLTK